MTAHADNVARYIAGAVGADADPAQDAAIPAGVECVTLSDVLEERVEWLAPGYLPIGKLVLLQGHPGCGKSQIALDFAARLTRGASIFDGPALDPATVVIVAGEDGAADTITPRFRVAGGDLRRAELVKSVVGADGQRRPPEVPTDIAVLESRILELGARLLVIDTLGSHLAIGYNANDNHEIKKATLPLAELAERTGCTVLIVHHLNKQQQGSAVLAGSGSVGIPGMARLVLHVGRPNGDEGPAVLAVAKSNLAKRPPSQEFQIEDRDGASRIVWGGESTVTADDMVQHRTREERTAVEDAAEFLRGFLADGPKLVTEIMEEGDRHGLKPWTIQRAKTAIGAEFQRGGFRGKVAWWLPAGAGGPVTDTDAKYGASDAVSDGPATRPHTSHDADAAMLRMGETEGVRSVAGLPACSVCGGPLRRRRSGQIRCPKCCGASRYDPFVGSAA